MSTWTRAVNHDHFHRLSTSLMKTRPSSRSITHFVVVRENVSIFWCPMCLSICEPLSFYSCIEQYNNSMDNTLYGTDIFKRRFGVLQCKTARHTIRVSIGTAVTSRPVLNSDNFSGQHICFYRSQVLELSIFVVIIYYNRFRTFAIRYMTSYYINNLFYNIIYFIHIRKHTLFLNKYNKTSFFSGNKFITYQ